MFPFEKPDLIADTLAAFQRGVILLTDIKIQKHFVWKEAFTQLWTYFTWVIFLEVRTGDIGFSLTHVSCEI